MRRPSVALIAVLGLLACQGSVVGAVQGGVTFSGVQPHLAAIGDEGFLAFGEDNVISVVRFASSGNTFGRPVQLHVPGKVALGMHRGPRIAVTKDAVLVTVVAGARGGGADGDVLLFRSTDHGVTWGAPIVINHAPGAVREGLHAIAASPDGLVVVAWLDLRQKGTRLYAALSRDHGATWAPDTLVYASPSGTICECCHPSLAIGPGGQVAVMFRNSLGGNRDMYLAQSRDGLTFSAATRLGTRSWALNACPMDGGGIAFTDDGVASTWRREGDVFLTTTRVAERRLGPGRDPAIASFRDRRDVAWSSSNGVLLARDDDAPVSLGRGRFPSLVAFQDATVVAWEDARQVVVRAIPRAR